MDNRKPKRYPDFPQSLPSQSQKKRHPNNTLVQSKARADRLQQALNESIVALYAISSTAHEHRLQNPAFAKMIRQMAVDAIDKALETARDKE